MDRAEEKWLSIDEEIREKLLKNVFCSKCLDEVEIVDYEIKNVRFGIVLEGKCATCQRSVARVIED